ncbi:MAG: dihydrofolate reductase family protein [Nocardioides sp.]|nr:dihydrofolate reductase family protein [Nocardioides sp.]
MRLVATEYLTVDGIFEEPGHWSRPYFGEEAQQFKLEELHATDALLLGRVTYEGFAAAWPTMSDPVGFADKMNTMPKYVVGTTLGPHPWEGAKLLGREFLDEIKAMRSESGGDLLLSGSAQVFDACHRAGLIDLYRFMVHPLILGTGRSLFDGTSPETPLRLVRQQGFQTGIVVLEYVRAPATG